MPRRSHYGRRVGKVGSTQKTVSCTSDSYQARFSRAMLEEEDKIIFEEMMENYCKQYEANQLQIDDFMRRTRGGNIKLRTAKVVVPLCVSQNVIESSSLSSSA